MTSTRKQMRPNGKGARSLVRTVRMNVYIVVAHNTARRVLTIFRFI